MIPDQLIPSLVNYTRVLSEAQSPRVAIWTIHFINQCVDWCLMIESELAILSEQEIQQCQTIAQQSLTTEWQLSLPPLSILLDALHQLYLCLIQNIYLSQEAYNYLLSTYQFLNSPDSSIRENLTQDLAILANNAATYNILQDMEKILSDDDNDDNDNDDDDESINQIDI